ncbi:MAG: hypothetical protein WCI88_05745 [Chloroflexota bacterium]
MCETLIIFPILMCTLYALVKGNNKRNNQYDDDYVYSRDEEEELMFLDDMNSEERDW